MPTGINGLIERKTVVTTYAILFFSNWKKYDRNNNFKFYYEPNGISLVVPNQKENSHYAHSYSFQIDRNMNVMTFFNLIKNQTEFLLWFLIEWKTVTTRAILFHSRFERNKRSISSSPVQIQRNIYLCFWELIYYNIHF